MVEKLYYSRRHATDPNAFRYDLDGLKKMFLRLYIRLEREGLFHRDFGFECVDAGAVPGKIVDVPYTVMRIFHNQTLWPVEIYCDGYREEELFDMIEFLYDHSSWPVDREEHGWNNCCVHYTRFDDAKGKEYFRNAVNELLKDYKDGFELSDKGRILDLPDDGLKQLLEADIVSDDKQNIGYRVQNAILKYRKAKSTYDERMEAVRELANILEFLKEDIDKYLDTKDAKDLFNIANNFGIRHHNPQQKTNYDKAIWLSWIFYHYLSTIQVVTRMKAKN
jgi:hypothetical protein